MSDKKNKKLDIPSINSLHKEKSTKETDRLNIFSIILNKCVEKIVYTNKYTDKTYIFFEVPEVLMGYANYDARGCIIYIMKKLQEQNYIVEFFDTNSIYIDWGSTKRQSNNKNTDLKSKTAKILQKYPNVKSVEYVYSDQIKKKKK